MHIRERKEEDKITIHFRKFRFRAGSWPRKLRSPGDAIDAWSRCWGWVRERIGFLIWIYLRAVIISSLIYFPFAFLEATSPAFIVYVFCKFTNMVDQLNLEADAINGLNRTPVTYLCSMFTDPTYLHWWHYVLWVSSMNSDDHPVYSWNQVSVFSNSEQSRYECIIFHIFTCNSKFPESAELSSPY